MEKTIITAHSGCEDTETDSMESIDLALKYGAEAIEIDVRVDEEGELRISHNEESQKEYQKKLTFREVIEKIRDTNLLVNCDIKEQEALQKTIEEAEQLSFPHDRLILSGCTTPEQLTEDESLVEKGNFFLNVEEIMRFVHNQRKSDENTEQEQQKDSDSHKHRHHKKSDEDNEQHQADSDSHKHQKDDDNAEDVVRCCQEMKVAGVNLPKWMIGSKVVTALQEAAIPISVWTVNESDVVKRCLEAGVYNITTRKVQQAIELRDSFYSEKGE